MKKEKISMIATPSMGKDYYYDYFQSMYIEDEERKTKDIYERRKKIINRLLYENLENS